MRSRTSSLPNVVLRVLALLAAFGGLAGVGNLLSANEASAVIERIYTLPFWDTYTFGYRVGGYPGHEGTDYFIGAYSSPGEPVVAAASAQSGSVKVVVRAITSRWTTETAIERCAPDSEGDAPAESARGFEGVFRWPNGCFHRLSEA